METKMILQRYKSFNDYASVEANLGDGTFFIIAETGQFGAIIDKRDKGDENARWTVLTPPATLKDFDIPDGDLVISSKDTINEAVFKLAQHVQTIGDNTTLALDKADMAINVVTKYEGDVDGNMALAIEELKKQTCVVSEEEFERKSLEGLNPNVIYYIYEND